MRNMDRLQELYEQLRRLRAAGVKMKDIARSTGLPSSVLSSLYSSVLPAYSALVAEGTAGDDALDEAIRGVNNVSKRRLKDSIDGLCKGVSAVETSFVNSSDAASSFLGALSAAAGRYLVEAQAYSGLYTCYGFSAHAGCMAAEPYMVRRVEAGDTVQRVCCRQVDGNLVEGICLFTPFLAGYMLFNGRSNARFALTAVCLRLPALSFPYYIKGISLSHDYNCNPTARRVILVREGDDIALDDFSRLEARVIAGEGLTGDLKAYYDYTCGEGDVVRSMVFTSPGKCLDDLFREKAVLGGMQGGGRGNGRL